MTNYFYLVSVEVGNVADNIVEATFSNQVVSMDFSAGITIRVNGTPANIVSVKRLDGEKIIQYKIDVSVVSTDNVKLSYTALPATGLDRSSQYGDYVTSDYGTILLETFTNRVVTNNVPSNDPIGDALRADCVAYWKMDEALGATRADSTGRGNNLTDTNSNVRSATGKINNAADWQGLDTDRELTKTSNADLKILNNESFYFALWVKIDATSDQTGMILYKGPPARDFSDNFEYDFIYYQPNGTLAFSNYASNTVEAVITPGVVCFAEFYFDHLTQKLGLAINNGAFTEVDQYAGDYPSSDYNVYVGNTLVSSANMFGWVDEVYFAKPSNISTWLTTEKRAYLYNSGAGRTLYP